MTERDACSSSDNKLERAMDKTKLKEYIYGNLASLFWSFFLLLGGGIFVAYYAHIQYMPEFDFSSSITILAAASVTATLTIAVLVATFILPGVFWSYSLGKESKVRSQWQDEEGNKSLPKTSLWFIFPILFLYGFAFIFLSNSVLAVSYLIFGLCVGIFLLYKVFGLHKKELVSETLNMVITYLTCSFLAFLPMYTLVILSTSGVEVSKSEPEYIGIVAAIFIAIANAAATAKPKNINGLVYFPFLGAVTLVVVLSSFEVFHRIPERVMEIYNFGAIKTEKVVFNESGCRTLKSHGLISNLESGKLCAIEDAKILSRLGKDMYLELGSIRLTIKNDNVLSWSIKQPE